MIKVAKICVKTSEKTLNGPTRVLNEPRALLPRTRSFEFGTVRWAGTRAPDRSPGMARRDGDLIMGLFE